MRPGLPVSAFFAALFVSGGAAAGTIEVKDAWIRTPPPGAPTAAGYAVIVNHGIASDRLTGAHSIAAASVELHNMSMAGGVMRMRPLQGVALSGSGAIRLAPSGDHLMLIGLKRPLTAGSHVKVTLQFQRAGTVAADFVVK